MALAPLIEKGHTLSNFIDSVNAEAEKELKLDAHQERVKKVENRIEAVSVNA